MKQNTMAKNNHFNEGNRRELDELLRSGVASDRDLLSKVLNYAHFMSQIENVLVVVSDMADGKSHISGGRFAECLGLTDYRYENSIWESRILSLMSPCEREEKYIAELRFFHYLRHLPKNKRSCCYMVSKLRFRFIDGKIRDVLHRMFYIYDAEMEKVRYAICIYGLLPFDIKGKSHVVDSMTGVSEELTASANNSILSRRECQVLSLIDSGMKSSEIAEQLNISVHTVSRHRQEIIGRLQVKNTHEACRLAKSMCMI